MARDARTEDAPRSRRGRPAAGTEAERRDRVLDAALAVLVDNGAEQMTMAAVAKRAGASKETLYRWFGDRDGLIAALIQRNADRSAVRVEHNLADATSPTAEVFRATLVAYGVGLLTLLTGEASVALNRAAMADAKLRVLLLGQGRHRIGPIVERYLERGDEAGILSLAPVGGAPAAFGLLYGLMIRDTQIRVLLGDPAPGGPAIANRAAEAVGQFLALCQPERP